MVCKWWYSWTSSGALLYAKRDKNCPNSELCKEELLWFFGVILISGYHSLPSEQDYWSNSADSGAKVVSESLSRKHFMQIYSIFHLVDNRELKIIQTKWQSRSNLRYPQQCTYTVQDFPRLFECGWLQNIPSQANQFVLDIRFGVFVEKTTVHINQALTLVKVTTVLHH